MRQINEIRWDLKPKFRAVLETLLIVLTWLLHTESDKMLIMNISLDFSEMG